jgi:ABC-type oligopeptide transport system substrate-binding subunit
MLNFKLNLSLLGWVLVMNGSALAQDDSEMRTLNVTLISPISTLHPYYYKGVETASIVHILFDALYQNDSQGMKPSLGTLTAKDLADDLNHYLKINDLFIKWQPSFGKTVSLEDVIYSFLTLNQNPLCNYGYADNFIETIEMDPQRSDHLLLRLKLFANEKTIREQLDFPLISLQAAGQSISVFNQKSRLFETSNSSSQAIKMINDADAPWLKIKDLLQEGASGTFSRNENGTTFVFLSRDKTRKYRSKIIKELNLADIQFSLFLYATIFPEALPNSLEIEEFEAFNEGQKARIKLKDQTELKASHPLMNLPVLFRSLDSSMASAWSYWGQPHSSYKFFVENNLGDALVLGRGKSFDKSKNKMDFGIQQIRFSRQTASDFISIKNSFLNGKTDMMLNVPLSIVDFLKGDNMLQFEAKGTQIEMIALNGADQVMDENNPLSDYRVRLALNYVLSKDEIFVEFEPPHAKIMNTPLTSNEARISNAEEVRLSTNQAKAEQLLTEAGWQRKNNIWVNQKGKPLSLKLIFQMRPGQRDRLLLELIAQQFRSFGIEITEPRNASLTPEDFHQQLNVMGDWHLALVRLFQSGGTDLSIYNPNDAAKNFMNFRPSPKINAKVNELFLAYETATDMQRRKVKEELALLLATESPALYLWDFTSTYLVNDSTVIVPLSDRPSAFHILENVDDLELNK